MPADGANQPTEQPAKPLGYLLRQAAGQHRLKVDRALDLIGVTAPQLLVLTLVESEPGCSSADLARRSLLTTATVSVLVNRLVDTGLLRRSDHPHHGKIQTLDLSREGRLIFDQCQLAVRPVEQELNAGLDPPAKAIVRAWLERALSG